MKVTITTPYATLEAELTAHQAKDILHTAMGYAANNADAAQPVTVNGPALETPEAAVKLYGEVLDHA